MLQFEKLSERWEVPSHSVYFDGTVWVRLHSVFSFFITSSSSLSRTIHSKADKSKHLANNKQTTASDATVEPFNQLSSEC